MTKTILVVGYGPGVSASVAERFGAEGFAVALAARSEPRLAEGVAALKAKGVDALACPADASDPDSVRAAVRKARAELGPIAALHWNAFSGGALGDLLAADPAAVTGVFDVAIVGLIAAVQEALPDLKAAGDGAVLVTNGAYGDVSDIMDGFAIQTGASGVALANAAKHKLVGLLAARLKPEGVHVGEVMIAGAIKGTPSDAGAMLIEGAEVADAFWRLYRDRTEVRARVVPTD
ncbi:MAG TPA: SDR family NAD(P)-dependent oxidoreductase [Caulobacteraceae bacterium]|nr:SDR family NAD(P)-dependent oxidoreductase [Caulobacteraceae bacterium]